MAVELSPEKELREIGRFHRDVDRFFDRFLERFPLARAVERREEWPVMDVSETPTEVVVYVELPGMDPSEVDISLKRRHLTIRGEKKHEREEKGESCYVSERRYGAFARTTQLPTEVDQEKIDATYEKGVLKVTMAKEKAETIKKIEVKAV